MGEKDKWRGGFLDFIRPSSYNEMQLQNGGVLF